MITTYPPLRDRLDPATSIFVSSEMQAAGDFTTAVSGGTVVFTTVGTYVNRYGFATAATGTGTTNRAAVCSQLQNQIALGYGEVTFCTMLQTPSALSDATNRYAIITGFNDLLNSVLGLSAVMFRYRDNINSGKWQLWSTVGSTGGNVSVDSGVTVAVSTWYKLECRINAAATLAQFYINGAYVGEISGAGNIPTDPVVDVMGFLVSINKNAGTTSRAIIIDYADFQMAVTR
jgi:hypothetical protein